jgi:hypothetical protein
LGKWRETTTKKPFRVFLEKTQALKQLSQHCLITSEHETRADEEKKVRRHKKQLSNCKNRDHKLSQNRRPSFPNPSLENNEHSPYTHVDLVFH